MKKISLLFVCAGLCALVACKKDKDDPKPGTDLESKEYYFNFKANSKSYSFKSKLEQYMTLDNDRSGGYQSQAGLFLPSLGLGVRFDHQPTDAELKGLAGKTLYFDDPAMMPELEFLDGTSQYGFYTWDTSDHAFFVKINSVTYKKQDSVFSNAIDIYVLNGTCNATLTDDDGTAPQWRTINGNFNFLISRVREK